MCADVYSRASRGRAASLHCSTPPSQIDGSWDEQRGELMMESSLTALLPFSHPHRAQSILGNVCRCSQNVSPNGTLSDPEKMVFYVLYFFSLFRVHVSKMIIKVLLDVMICVDS